MRILLAEDEPALANWLVQALRQSDFQVDWVNDGRLVASSLKASRYDALILDLGLPGRDGHDVLDGLRDVGHGLPVLILTARDSLMERVHTLKAGADDFLAKPFELAELEARVRALTRRSAGGVPVIRVGRLSYDQVGRMARIDDDAIELSAREVGLLEVLVTRAGRLVSKDQLVDHLCGWGEEVSHNAIEVYVHRLRKKLEPGDVHIATVRGLGYCLEKPRDPPASHA